MYITISHDHKCQCIAKAPAMFVGREWWIGKLLEPVKEYPHETHCLHLKTPLKDVTLLCNEADFRNLIIICQAVIGKQNDSWLDFMIKLAKNIK